MTRPQGTRRRARASYALSEKICPSRTGVPGIDERLIWVRHEQGARVYSSLANPYACTQACADIAADGEIVAAKQYLSRHLREVELVARQYRALSCSPAGGAAAVDGPAKEGVRAALEAGHRTRTWSVLQGPESAGSSRLPSHQDGRCETLEGTEGSVVGGRAQWRRRATSPTTGQGTGCGRRPPSR